MHTCSSKPMPVSCLHVHKSTRKDINPSKYSQKSDWPQLCRCRCSRHSLPGHHGNMLVALRCVGTGVAGVRAGGVDGIWIAWEPAPASSCFLHYKLTRRLGCSQQQQQSPRNSAKRQAGDGGASAVATVAPLLTPSARCVDKKLWYKCVRLLALGVDGASIACTPAPASPCQCHVCMSTRAQERT